MHQGLQLLLALQRQRRAATLQQSAAPCVQVALMAGHPSCPVENPAPEAKTWITPLQGGRSHDRAALAFNGLHNVLLVETIVHAE